MAQVSFNFYDDDQRISVQLKGDDVYFVDYQIERCIEFLLGQGFQQESIYKKLDDMVEEYDRLNPGKLDEIRAF